MTSRIRPLADHEPVDSCEQFCGLSLPTFSNQRGWFMSSFNHAASSSVVIASTAPLVPCLDRVNPTRSRVASGPTRPVCSGMRERVGPFDPANTTSTAVQLGRGMHARAGPVLWIEHRRPGRRGDERTSARCSAATTSGCLSQALRCLGGASPRRDLAIKTLDKT